MERNRRHKFIPCGAVWLKRVGAIHQKSLRFDSQPFCDFEVFTFMLTSFEDLVPGVICIYKCTGRFASIVAVCFCVSECYDHFVMTSECL